jgi:hypothetical protein
MKKIAVMANAGAGKDTVADMILDIALDHAEWGTVPGEKIALAMPLKDFCDSVFRFTKPQLWGSSEERNRVDRRYSDERKTLWGKIVRWRNKPLYEMHRRHAAERFNVWAHEWLDDVLPHGIDVSMAYEKLRAWFLDVVMQEHITARYALQTLGTEFGRYISPDIWVDFLLKEVETKQKEDVDAVVITDCRFVNEAKKLREQGFEIWRLIRPYTQAIVGGVVNHASEREQTSPEMEQYISTTIINDGTLADLKEKVRALLEV